VGKKWINKYKRVFARVRRLSRLIICSARYNVTPVMAPSIFGFHRLV